MKRTEKKHLDGLMLTASKQPTGKIVIAGIERNNIGNRFGFPNGFWRYPLPLQFTNEQHPYYPDNIGKPVKCSKKPKPLKTGSHAFPKICELSVDSTQLLFDCLWREGFRPSCRTKDKNFMQSIVGAEDRKEENKENRGA